MGGSAVECIVLCPVVDGESPRLALGAARAGAIAVLDLEFARGVDDAARVVDVFLQTATGRLGLRLGASQLESFTAPLEQLADRAHWLIVAADEGGPPLHALRRLPPSDTRRLLVEVCDADSGRALAGMPVAGLIAKGNESGGVVGEDGAFVLTQKLLDVTGAPIFVRGGIGPHTAAACHMAGAAGVVLDDQLLLVSETFLPRARWRFVAQLTGQETRTVERSTSFCRVLPLPELHGPFADHRQSSVVDGPSEQLASPGSRSSDRETGWGATATAWPAGQAVGLARYFRDRYRTVGRAVQAVRQSCGDLPELARAQRALAPAGPLATAHGTRFPIVQGPMTRVSDTPEFAEAVSRAGALPFLALSLMRREPVMDLLRRTEALLDGRPWGVGVLGFVPQALREEQVEAILQVKPPFALIAGGRPDQSAALEAGGTATYLHAPSPRLLQLFLEQGARRFVFEGRECGGHIGPLSSFTLWEHMVQTLLDHIGPRSGSDLHVLFAGGIHDARSAAMVATLGAPLVARGVRIGVLMGTAYLFTGEAVSCGAILPAFQDEARRCTRTASLETGPGHVTRCAVTPFVQEFQAVRSRLLAEGKSADDIRDALEVLNIGRLRIASKGVTRDAGGAIVAVDERAQRADGMYMIGQAATLQQQVRTVAALHDDVSVGATALLDRPERRPLAPRPAARPSDVAIVGIGTLLPGADTPHRYWENILAQRIGITEIPRDRFDWRLYFDEDRTKRDRIYAKWGGFIDEVSFDPTRFGIPPNSMRSIDPLQLLTLEVVRRALADAGYPDGGADREHTAVILGAGGGLGDLGLHYGVRAELPRVADRTSAHAWDRLPEWTEESFPGCLMNVAAGRVANRFNFGGSNFTVDAACASSLAAIDIAVRELEAGRSHLAIAGGIDTLQNPFAYFCFAKTQALSPRGVARAFDRNADGIVISEGLAVVVLKRLADAERDGDRVYGVIKAIGSSSDGKALGLTAPLPEGQKRALRRAYEKAGVRPSSVGLFEAHGTGTAVGDRAEAETIISTLNADGARSRSSVLGSVKTLIGHTKATAGAAGLIKAALALHYRVLPPHAGVEQPIDPIADPNSPVSLLKQPSPWLRERGRPRRAGVSAFGFGGTNFHAVLEEAPDSVRGPHPPTGHDGWPCELVVLRGATPASLIQQVVALDRQLENGERTRLRDLAWTCATRDAGPARHPFCLAMVASSIEDVREQIAAARACLERKPGATMPRLARLSAPDRPPQTPRGIAFLFPGQGAQHVDMLREAALYLPAFREALEFADAHLDEHFDRPLSRYIYPAGEPTADEEAANRERLTDTRIAQPAIGALELCCLELARQLGIPATMAAGHSYGELAALHAAGVLSKPDFLTLSALRGRALGRACEGGGTSGAMAAITLEREHVEERLGTDAGLVCANHNAPRQSVVSGPRDAVERLVQRLGAEGIAAQLLPVAGAFHSPLMAAACEPLEAALQGVPLASPHMPVFSNVTGDAHGGDPEQIRRLLSAQVLQPVEFVRQIERMYERGARLFVEMGPRSVLTGLVSQILAGREFTAVSMGGRTGALEDVLLTLATLAVENVEIRLDALFESRDVAELDNAATRPVDAVAGSRWFVGGGWARVSGEPKGRSGKLPFLEQGSVADDEEGTATPVRAVPGRVEPPPVDAATNAPGVRGDVPFAPHRADQELATALVEYQGVMREFLAVQERIMTRFLTGSADATEREPQVAEDARAPVPAPPAARSPDTSLPSVDGTAARAAADADRPVRVEAERRSAEGPSPWFDREQVMERLLALASERTGYPHDVLGTDQDVEAELGIDSIKRVEILGALLQQLPEAMRAVGPGMEVLTRLKTFGAIADTLVAAPRVAATSRGQRPAADEHTQTPPPAPVRFDILECLLSLVSERTGYPRDVLGLDQDVEADLGIDSIKRVEILGALARQLPAELSSYLQGAMERFTRIKTLEGVVAALASAGASGRAQAEPAQSTPAVADVQPAPRVPHFRIEARSEPLGEESRSLPAGLWIVTEDVLGVANAIVRSLAGTGARPVLVDPATLTDATAIADAWRTWTSAWGPVRGIVHLAALGAPAGARDLGEWRRRSDRHVKSLFRILKLAGEDLRAGAAEDRAFLLAASAFGGWFGRAGGVSTGCATAGGMLGLLKTAAREWPGVRVKALDVDPAHSAERIATECLTEIRSGDRRMEVGYPSAGRTVFETVPADFGRGTPSLDGGSPSREWVVLLTGGARGITAEAAYAFAGYGLRLVIVGRSALPPAVEAPETARLEDASALRQFLFQRARADHAARVAPAAIESQVHALLGEREMRRNLARLTPAAASVEYVSLDARDEAAMAGLLDRIYREYGRLDIVVHGAGIIEDRTIPNKDEGSFERVFDTKAISSVVLARHLRPEGLRALVFYASVAGRIGNPGQADYAAANEVLNRLAWELDRQWPRTQVLSVNWGPWEGSGMATEEVARGFRDRGILPVPRDAGTRWLLDALTTGRKGDVELIVGEGPWAVLDECEPASAHRSETPPPPLPLVRQRHRLDSGGAVTMEHVFSLAADPYLADHRLDEVPVLPAAVVLEWVAEFVQAGWPGWMVTSVRNLRVLKGLTLEGRDAIGVVFRARASTHTDSDSLQVGVEVVDVANHLTCYVATAVLETAARVPPTAPLLVPLGAGSGLDVTTVYRDYLFHAGRFRLLTGVESLTAAGADAQAIVSAPGAFLDGVEGSSNGNGRVGEWLFDPGLVDTAPQLAIVWSRAMHNTTALPHRIGAATRFGAGPIVGPARVSLRVKPSPAPHFLIYDAFCCEQDGTVRLHLQDVESACTAALNRVAAQVR